MNANEKQIGGTHYAGELQHWDVVIAMKWDYLIGNATKYLWRLGKKGDTAKAVEDIDKAIHYLEKKRELLLGKLAEETAAKLSAPRAQKSLFSGVTPEELAEGYPTRDYVAQD